MTSFLANYPSGTIGPPVTSPPATAPSPTFTIKGRRVKITPLQESHAPALWSNLGGPQNAHLYTYMFSDPPPNLDSFISYIKGLIEKPDWLTYTIFIHSDQGPPTNSQAAGLIAYINTSVIAQSTEIGHVLFSPLLQRTTAATECIYLLLKHAFDDLGFERVEWKCDDRNMASRRAAFRLGFVYEGTLRRKEVLKGRTRSTAYFAVLKEGEWDFVKGAFEEWLKDSNFEDGKQIKTLEAIREGILKKASERANGQ